MSPAESPRALSQLWLDFSWFGLRRLSGSRRNRANQIVSRQRPPDPLQLELNDWLDCTPFSTIVKRFSRAYLSTDKERCISLSMFRI